MSISDNEEDGEILGDESDQELVNINKTTYELKKMREEKKKEHVPVSAPGSKAKDFTMQNAEQTESEPNSAHGSKIHKSQTNFDFNNEDADTLRTRLLCVSCESEPKCVMIQGCKHVPFCVQCDKAWKLKAIENNKDPECPLCRKSYKKTTQVKIF